MKFSRIFLGILSLWVNSGFSQQIETVNIKVEYEFSHVTDTTQPDNPIKQNYLLYVGKNMDKYSDLYNAMNDEGKPIAGSYTDEGGNVKKVIRMGIDRSMFKKIASGHYYWETPFPGKTFEVGDTLPKLAWKITHEVRSIKGYKCQKATTYWKGRDYYAWFCPGLPYSTGPWKFTGLPGLILDIVDGKNEVGWRAVKVTETGKEVTIAMKKGAEIVTQAEFKKLEAAMRKDAMAMRGAIGNGSQVASVTAVPMSALNQSGDGKTKVRGYNNPIEKVK